MFDRRKLIVDAPVGSGRVGKGSREPADATGISLRGACRGAGRFGSARG
jgi:hypothetical protein